MPLDGSTACMTIEGATDTEVFLAYVGRVLGPTLRKGDMVILDNLSPHKSEPTLSLIAQAGAQVLFLPAYSPEFNPIEKMWSKIKASLRSAQARTQSALIKAIASASVTPQDAMNWFCPLRLQFYLNSFRVFAETPSRAVRRCANCIVRFPTSAIRGTMSGSRCVPDAGPERPRVLLTDDHPAMLALRRGGRRMFGGG
jgi:transposase